MKTRLFSLAFAFVLICAAGADDALPGRDGEYQFAENILAGTMWKGDMNPQGFLVVRFEPSGRVCYTYSGGTWHNGNWKQDGDRLHMVIGRANVTFDAVIRGDHITGGGGNGPGDRRRLELKRVGPISKEEMEKLTIIEP
jgi:hypothetical protein